MNAVAVAEVPRETVPPAVAGARLEDLPLDLVDVGANVRVDPGELAELAASIAELGVLQPIRAIGPHADGRYRAVWGQRRILASRQAGRTTIPALVEAAADVDAPGARRSIEQLAENLQRKDLNPIEEARAMREVLDASKGLTQDVLADRLGRSRPWVSNALGLLDAPVAIQKAVQAGELTPSHAKALKGLAPKTQQQIARDAIANGYSAHRLEKDVQRRKRIAEDQAKREREDAEQVRKNLERLQASIADLAGRKQPGLNAEIVVDRDRWGDKDAEAKALADRLRKAGFTNVRVWARGDTLETRPKGCGCTAWKARLHSNYSYASRSYETKLSVTKACTVAAHRNAADRASHAAEQAKYALQGKVQEHVKASAFGVAIPSTSTDTPLLIGIPRILAEGVLWEFIGYRLPEWAAARGGSRQKPWAALHALTDEELAAELAKEVAGDFRDKAGYHIDWTALASELGVTTEAAAAAKS